MKRISPDQLRLAPYIQPGSSIFVGHSTAEPATLLEALVTQRADFPHSRLTMHASFSGIVRPEHVDGLRIEGLSGLGTQQQLVQADAIELIPTHLSDFGRMIAQGESPVDVALLSVSQPDAQGRFSLGLVNDYMGEAARRARIVIAEMNSAMPFTHGGPFLMADRIDLLVPTERAIHEFPPGQVRPTDRAIAQIVASYIGDGSILQFGVGSVPDGIALSLQGFRDIGIHSGLISDPIRALINSGVVTNARKPIDTGITVGGAVWGTRALYDFVHDNPAIHVRPLSYTHAPETFAQLPGFVSVNSALEVDLSGQANLEAVGGRYVGAIGGAVDFVRGARLAPGGRSIVALPATGGKGAFSRIVTRLDGPVTIARSDIDTVVTEFGSAELRGQTLRERARRLIAIAHPDFREALERDFTDGR
ncbi:Acyl-CoA hydrolase [Sphingobium faniae]|nr:Acyl-CoA hydrolase [Sphingobium faniae]